MFGKKTVADQFVEVLVQAGVERVFGIVGDSLNALSDAIRRNNAIEWVHVYNEESAAFAAAAEAQLTGELAVYPAGWEIRDHLAGGCGIAGEKRELHQLGVIPEGVVVAGGRLGSSGIAGLQPARVGLEPVAQAGLLRFRQAA